MKKNILIIVIILICVLAPLGLLAKCCVDQEKKNQEKASKYFEDTRKALDRDRYKGRTINLDETKSNEEINKELSKPEN